MGTFREVAMRCTQEQFDAIEPKLRDLKIWSITPFTDCNYLVNNVGGETKTISNVMNHAKGDHNREVHEEWNERIFLEACGIEVETLQEKEQRLLKELEAVRKNIEDSKVKVGDWCKFWDDDESRFIVGKFERVVDKENYSYYVHGVGWFKNCMKITDSALLLSLHRLFKH